MLPWIALAAGMLSNMQQKKQQKHQLAVDLAMNRAQELGANVGPLRAQQARQQIDDQPIVDPRALISAIGSTTGTESIDDKLAREMAKRGLMRGYQPF